MFFQVDYYFLQGDVGINQVVYQQDVVIQGFFGDGDVFGDVQGVVDGVGCFLVGAG